MSRFRRATTAALLGVALLAAASIGIVGLGGALSTSDGAPPEVVETANSTGYVMPAAENITRQEYSEATIDVGTAIVTDAERLQARHDGLVFDVVESQGGTRAVVSILEQRVAALERRHEWLLRNYSSDSISTGTLLRELARIEGATQHHRAAVERLQAEELPDDVANRLSTLSVEPTMLGQPVTERVRAAMTAGEEPVRVYVAAAEDGIVTATVIEDRYIRQATLRGEREPSGDDQFAEGAGGRAQAASDRGTSLYSVSANTVRGFTDTSVYEFNANHSLGETVAYLDGATTNPFQESQYKQPVVEIPAQTSSATTGSFRLNVQYTNTTGPMAISLLGTGSDSLPPAAVSVNDQPVGTIEGGGQLWTIQPVGDFTVTATTEDGESASVRVIP
jgi:hypothetical protein